MSDDDKRDTDDETGMPDSELATVLAEMNRQAIGYLSDAVSVDQDDNLDRYLGKPYGDEQEGASNAVSMDVAEVVDWALPDLLEPFISGDRVVEYEPAKPGDEEFTDQAAELAQYCFTAENSGIIVLYDTVKTALIQKIGITKTWWKEEEKEEKQELTGLPISALNELSNEPGVTVTEIDAAPIETLAVPAETLAAYEDGKVYTVEVTRVKKCGKVAIESVPPEEFKVSQRSKDLESDYLCHETEVRRSTLVAMGFDYDLVMSLEANKAADSQSRKNTRFPDEQRTESGKRAMLSDYVTLCEEYPLLADSAGKASRWQVFRVNKTILDKEKVDGHPFDAWTPDRIPHRLIGLALADKVKQTQYIKTHLTRQMLDNVYLANNPRFEVPNGAATAETIDDLLTYRVGGLIRTKGEGGMVRPIEVPDRSGTALQAISYMDSVREQQSGITRNGIAISSEAIDPKSATEARNNDRNEQARKRLMVRMLAETLVCPIFKKILKLLVMHQDAEKSVYMSGSFQSFDPRSWNAEMRATVSVGLGYANKDEDLMASQMVGAAQEKLFPIGLVKPEHGYELAKKIVRAVGWKFPDKYFVDPETPEGQQHLQQHAQSQAQDPRMAEVQGKLQLKQAEMQFASQEATLSAQRDIQLEMLKAQAKQAVEERKADFDFKARMTEIKTEYDLGLQQLAAEMALKQQQMAFEARMQVQQQAIDAHQADKALAVKGQTEMHKNNIRAVRFGGKVG